MIDLLDTKLLIFISKNKLTFALVVLLLGNVYQYFQRDQLIAQSNSDKKELNQKIQERDKENLDYERNRSEKLEFLLSNLAKNQPDNGEKSH